MQPPLENFSPPVRAWFAAAFGAPTPPQAQGWPPIQRGEHTLILAPTGSGKTLAAFLWAIDGLLRELSEEKGDEGGPGRAASGGEGRSGAGRVVRSAPRPGAGIRLVYVSPLKALNNDISRNLRIPLQGIRAEAEESGVELPEIRVAVRSGDTPSAERQRLLRNPPHILITTPESLYLLLTSPRARDMFSPVRTVIVDEIHTMAGSKRGVHLSLSLERLENLAAAPVQRIGLSATIRPLDEVAAFLGGAAWSEEQFVPRLVTIVDAGYHKELDLGVETVVEDFLELPGGSIWPAVIPRVVELIREHRTTLIFVNNRRLAERTADRLNEQLAAEARGEDLGLVIDGTPRGSGFAAAGRGSPLPRQGIEPIRAHHGSMAREARLQMEQGLKEGRLRALVGTSSLELGIDIGSVDLVVQLQSPKAVAQGLQRVGRSGHLVGQTSKGRIFPTHREDLVEAAVVAGGMLRGEVEEVRTPVNALDVLAQQLVAVVSVEDWQVEELYRLVRQAYPYRRLSERAFGSVLEMLSGRYPADLHRELRPRLSWDKVNDRLSALPGARLLALTNGGTIPDRGAYGAYLPDGKTRIGELDEEFVFETRPGDTFMLGSQVWRVLDITDERVVVKEAPGALARMPFWHGDYPWRPFELGRRVGQLRRELAGRVKEITSSLGLDSPGDLELLLAPAMTPDGDLPSDEQTVALGEEIARLGVEHSLDESSAQQLLSYVAAMLDRTGSISSDKEILLETFSDAVGDPRIVVHSPFGGRVNGPWGLALADALREQTGIEVEVQSGDDGILLRLPGAEGELPLEVVANLGPVEARERLLRSLADSAVFGAQFRMNAARSLLLPGNRPGRRTPFWLQRLRAKDLLQAVRRFPDFPVMAETFRDCLEDVMDLPHLEQVLADIRRGEIRVTRVESAIPSPVAQGLMWSFTNIYLYEWDTPKAERQLQTLTVSRELLGDILRDVSLDEVLRPEALAEVESRVSGAAPARRARSAEELAVMLLEHGDLSQEEMEERSAGDPLAWLEQLSQAGRVEQLDDGRWVPVEMAGEYRAAFGPVAATGAERVTEAAEEESRRESRRRILLRFLSHSGPVPGSVILNRYPFGQAWLEEELSRLVEERQLAYGRFRPGGDEEFVDPRVLEQIHKRTKSLLRSEVRPVTLAAYADFLARWQHIFPGERLQGRGGLRQVLQQLRAVPVAGLTWERDVIPLRLAGFDPLDLEELFQGGELVWVASGGSDLRRARVRLLFRGEGAIFLGPAPEPAGLSAAAQQLYAFLREEGALFFAEIRSALELEEPEARAALAELALEGLVTSDSLPALRDLFGSSLPRLRPGGAGRSSLEEELARRLTGSSRRGRHGHRHGFASGPSRAAYREARRRVRHHLEETPPNRGIRSGRWSLVHRFGVLGRPLSEEERVSRQARQLLARHGVVTRFSLEREEGSWDWPALYAELQRLEMRGQARRGYFVSGLPGAQFALPEAVERLRSVAQITGLAEPAELTVLNATDPANLWGPSALSGGSGEVLSFTRVPSAWVVMERGLPLLVAEDGGARLRARAGADEVLLQEALRLLLDHLTGFLSRVHVNEWDGPVLENARGLLLESVGFYRDHPGMTYERRTALPGSPPLTPGGS